ncbi:TetR/AcrR family transcriptional regulator [Actinomadura litoris]|uniref:TetR/AcrR family transcriptional regulator n=1 Tax=Actinomadura litoris TaxID=2678616 RepID=UPI001FA7FD42|nr:TetR/AcrR family transcriptional regulator [Actinomadura litoris]
MEKTPGLRADATRNRAKILQSARDLITAHGPQIGMDEIARSAGVAVGTLYRHFPTKNALVNAIMIEIEAGVVAGLEEAVARIEGGGSALAEIELMLRRLAVDMADDRALRAVATRIGAYSPDNVRRHADAALGRMVAAAHAAGALRPDVTSEDIGLLIGTMPGAEVPEPARRRWVELTLRSIVSAPVQEGSPGGSPS